MQQEKISFLQTTEWWRTSFRSAWSYIPHCLGAAIGLGVADAMMVAVLDSLTASLGSSFNAAVNTVVPDMTELAKTGLACCIGLLISLSLSLWAMGLWLLRLTAYARASLKSLGSPTEADFQEAIQEIGHKKGFLIRFWFLASTYLLIPVTLFSYLLSMSILNSPQYASLVNIHLPFWVPVLQTIVSIFLILWIAAYSLIALVVSSVTSLSAKAAVAYAASLLFGQWKQIGVVVAVILVVNMVIAFPQVIINCKLPIAVDIGLQFWLGLVSSVLWPWSVVPVCKLLKKELK